MLKKQNHNSNPTDSPEAFEAGPTEMSSFLRWVNSQGAQVPRKRFWFHIEVVLDPKNQYIVESKLVATPGVLVAVDDGAMGISLLTQVQTFCDDNESNRCVVAGEFYWGELLDDGPTKEAPWPVALLRVAGIFSEPPDIVWLHCRPD